MILIIFKSKLILPKQLLLINILKKRLKLFIKTINKKVKK